MNKILSKALTVGLIFSSILSISSCDEYKSNDDLRKEEIAQIIDSLANRDHEKVKNLFAPNAIIEIPNLDDSVAELFNYYKGEYVSNKKMGFTISELNNYNVYTKNLDISFDITTTECLYRVAILDYRAADTSDKNNIGLWNLFIIRYEDDPYKQYTYWGEREKGTGLFMGAYRVMEELIEVEGSV